MACVAGCIIKNGTSPASNWRTVSGFNPLRHPDLPVFHFSLACNHCEDAPCMKNCPALAYSRDEVTGAIIHHAESCIGCKYCTWACPYDAPKYNITSGVVEKCNFCADSIVNGQRPACVEACPVEALGFGEVEQGIEVVVPGFVNRNIKPSIQIVPLANVGRGLQVYTDEFEPIVLEDCRSEVKTPASKIKLSKEWTLVPFTLTVAVLVGWLSAGITAEIFIILQWFMALGLVSLLLSTLHLGKKMRAWRSMLNVKGSWLSREILSYSLFLGSGTLYLLLGQMVWGVMALIAGGMALVSIDMVYKVVDSKDNPLLHSAMVWITGLMVWAFLFESSFFIAFTLTLKAGLYLVRKVKIYRKRMRPGYTVSLLRMGCLMLPIFLFYFSQTPDVFLLMTITLLGEIADRLEFYHELEIVTPEIKLHQLFHKGV
jgi:Fe-S-cluster-containing dehydrogenase component/DMSO reductase anchor subunit